MVIGLSPVRVLGVAIGCVGDNDDDDVDVADPTEAARRSGSGKSEIVGARQVVAAQQRVHWQKNIRYPFNQVQSLQRKNMYNNASRAKTSLKVMAIQNSK